MSVWMSKLGRVRITWWTMQAQWFVFVWCSMFLRRFYFWGGGYSVVNLVLQHFAAPLRYFRGLRLGLLRKQMRKRCTLYCEDGFVSFIVNEMKPVVTALASRQSVRLYRVCVRISRKSRPLKRCSTNWPDTKLYLSSEMLLAQFSGVG